MPTRMKKNPSDAGVMEQLTLLAVGTDGDDLRSLAEILRADHCYVKSASSCSEALRAIGENTPSIVACEGELPDGSWRDLMSQLHDLESPPPVIVMSRHADERLWAEVLNLGGYDVLAKPLERIEVSRVMKAAWRHACALTA